MVRAISITTLATHIQHPLFLNAIQRCNLSLVNPSSTRGEAIERQTQREHDWTYTLTLSSGTFSNDIINIEYSAFNPAYSITMRFSFLKEYNLFSELVFQITSQDNSNKVLDIRGLTKLIPNLFTSIDIASILKIKGVEDEIEQNPQMKEFRFSYAQIENAPTKKETKWASNVEFNGCHFLNKINWKNDVPALTFKSITCDSVGSLPSNIVVPDNLTIPDGLQEYLKSRQYTTDNLGF